MALSKYLFWECYHIRNHLDIKHHRSWENLVNTEPPAEALLKNSFLLDKGFPYLNSGLVSSPCRLVLCHRVREASSSKAEEESLDELPFMPLFWWLEPVGLMFIITARGTAWAVLSGPRCCSGTGPHGHAPTYALEAASAPLWAPLSFLFHSSSSSIRIKPIWISIISDAHTHPATQACT